MATCPSKGKRLPPRRRYGTVQGRDATQNRNAPGGLYHRQQPLNHRRCGQNILHRHGKKTHKRFLGYSQTEEREGRKKNGYYTKKTGIPRPSTSTRNSLWRGTVPQQFQKTGKKVACTCRSNASSWTMFIPTGEPFARSRSDWSVVNFTADTHHHDIVNTENPGGKHYRFTAPFNPDCSPS